MKKKRKIRSFPHIARRVIALTLAMWLLAMSLLTWAVAADMQVQIENQARYYTTGNHRNPTRNDEIPDDLPGSMEIAMIDNLGYGYSWLNSRVGPLIPIVYEFNGVGSDDWLYNKWDLYFGYETAVAFFQEDQMLMNSGNYLSFVYTTQENWSTQDLEPVSHGYIDLDAVPGTLETIGAYLDTWPIMGGVGISLFIDVLRMEGYFEGVQFYPVTIDSGRTNYGGHYPLEQMSKIDSGGRLGWSNIFTGEAPADRELVTIYAWELGGIRADTGPVTVEGVRYESLEELVATDRENWGLYRSSNLLESVFIWRMPHEDSFGAYTYALAVRYWPLQYALVRLIPCYLISFAVAAVLLLLVLLTIRRNLTRPLEQLADKIQRNAPITPDAAWAEPRALQEYYDTSRQTIHEANTQIAQLNTALEYARNAEESRRQLVSNITHELKTPLAVIHSYAEGLQAGIAGEKKEHYLNVILEESEKMDALVLQMLDLSRLEAGRVRLASDRFSLLTLVQNVAEKLKPLAEAKHLELRWGLTLDVTVTADESRMEQVVTNLMGNAVKYAPADTTIHLNLYSHMDQAHFRIENVSPHLTEEALAKVWDSFYRADPSRRSPGTGLGLTIVKTIVELHRGSCSVRNTTLHDGGNVQTGVEFGFQIPI